MNPNQWLILLWVRTKSSTNEHLAIDDNGIIITDKHILCK